MTSLCLILYQLKECCILCITSILLSFGLSLFICLNSDGDFNVNKHWYIFVGLAVVIEAFCCCCYKKLMEPSKYTTTYVVEPCPHHTKVFPVSYQNHHGQPQPYGVNIV